MAAAGVGAAPIYNRRTRFPPKFERKLKVAIDPYTDISCRRSFFETQIDAIGRDRRLRTDGSIVSQMSDGTIHLIFRRGSGPRTD